MKILNQVELQTTAKLYDSVELKKNSNPHIFFNT